jgi:hypothetical protein
MEYLPGRFGEEERAALNLPAKCYGIWTVYVKFLIGYGSSDRCLPGFSIVTVSALLALLHVS